MTADDPNVSRPISNLEFRIETPNVDSSIRPIFKILKIGRIGQADEWTNPHSGFNSKFEIRNWTGGGIDRRYS